MRRALFLFHRDLRLEDNLALLEACEHCDKVVPAFLLPDEQIDPTRNAYFSHAAVQFMCESLQDLDARLPGKCKGKLLLIRCQDPVSALDCILSSAPFHEVAFNADDSLYARERDAKVHALCTRMGLSCRSVPGDYGIVPIDACLLPDGRPYTNLSMFAKRLAAQEDSFAHAHENNVEDTTHDVVKGGVASTKLACLTPHELKEIKKKLGCSKRFEVLEDADRLNSLYEPLAEPAERGGREHGLAAIARAVALAPEYEETRERPALEERGTTRLSPHLRFGTVSIREVYAALAASKITSSVDNVNNDKSNNNNNNNNNNKPKPESLLRELAFREFYRKIYALDPVLQRGRAFRANLDSKIPWKKKEDAPQLWEAWTTGRTGFPLVDAGMAQLLKTGFVHNRIRMVVASFATRYLGFDWRDCARFYYSKLVDADPFANTAGWQWAAGVGVDSAPYFRRPLNPFRQSARFDPDCEYVKRYVPETRAIAARDLHRWPEEKVRAKYAQTTAYPGPVIDQKDASDMALAAFKKAAAAR
jgi:deoxyribodipyrimidine photo-lyase